MRINLYIAMNYEGVTIWRSRKTKPILAIEYLRQERMKKQTQFVVD